jgi:cbb3-type cytochrome c oxidase subunit III
MSFRRAVAFVALCSIGPVFAADPPAQSAPATPAPATQPEASPIPAQTEVAPPVVAAVAVKPGDAVAGQAKSSLCAACHGIDGNPASSQYPKLAGQHEDYIAREINMFKSHARDSAIMMGFAMTLSPQDAHDIGAYFASKTSLPGVADSKLVARGESLYRGGDKSLNVPACMACHGPDGRGNPGAEYPQLAGQYSDYVTQKLTYFRQGKGWGDDDRSKIMPAVAKNLSDADIAALSSYVEGLHSSAKDNTAAK